MNPQNENLYFENFRADLFSRTFRKNSKFGTNFREISRKLLARKNFCITFFKIWVSKIFTRINFRALATKLQKFGTNFRAISRKSSEILRKNARKFIRTKISPNKVRTADGITANTTSFCSPISSKGKGIISWK